MGAGDGGTAGWTDGAGGAMGVVGVVAVGATDCFDESTVADGAFATRGCFAGGCVTSQIAQPATETEISDASATVGTTHDVCLIRCAFRTRVTEDGSGSTR